MGGSFLGPENEQASKKQVPKVLRGYGPSRTRRYSLDKNCLQGLVVTQLGQILEAQCAKDDLGIPKELPSEKLNRCDEAPRGAPKHPSRKQGLFGPGGTSPQHLPCLRNPPGKEVFAGFKRFRHVASLRAPKPWLRGCHDPNHAEGAWVSWLGPRMGAWLSFLWAVFS